MPTLELIEPEDRDTVVRRLDSALRDGRSFVLEMRLRRAGGETRSFGDLGCGVALDDFGTGFGSFTYLKHLPTTYLKIDMEFVSHMRENASDRQVVKSITEVAHSLGKQIIAEGVEDEETVVALREYGVDFAQGFHIGRPVPLPAVPEAVAARGQAAPHQ